MAEQKYITVRGARVNNLKNLDVDIPLGKLVVITGVSGSGKSSLAFDTLYAEGQRRYVESLSAYARQFLGRMAKPECDFIKGIPPAIAIEQKVSSRNPRSTVGTSTEVYEYLRLLYARVGKTYSPISGALVKKHTPEDVVRCMSRYPEGTRFVVMAPLVLCEGRALAVQLDACLKQGYTRLDADGGMLRIEELLAGGSTSLEQAHPGGKGLFLVIDRMAAGAAADTVSRLADSAETAFFEGDGCCVLRFYPQGSEPEEHVFSNRFEADGISFEEPTDQMFSFNSPVGACPKCEGFGRTIGIDESLVIPNRSLSVYDGAVVCWRGEKMGEWRQALINAAPKCGFPVFKPYRELSGEERRMLWEGTEHFLGINDFFRMLEEGQYKIQNRVMLARYRGKTVCPICHGTRLKAEAAYVKVGGKAITELAEMPVDDLRAFFKGLRLDSHDRQVAERILTEINNRLAFLSDVGLGYLTLNRPSNTLSGGESQRINLATSLGSSLVGSLYILDEPSIGLHSRDTARLVKVLRQLQQLGNTVIVVEHDEEIIRAADYIIDIGPLAGRLGGEIVYQGDLHDLKPGSRSHTVRYLLGEEVIEPPLHHRQWNRSILVRGACENNLKDIDVRFPLNVMTVVTGVSGSGKSTLVRDILYRALLREYDEGSERPGEFRALEGDIRAARGIEFVDQNPIGKSSRSNPVTYIKAYDDIRKLYADQPLAKQMGYSPAYFSFNVEGGRCEECKGEGTVTVEMQFMADIVLECESCHGKRFKADTLEVKFNGLSIYDVLELTVDQAIAFFTEGGQPRIAQRLKPLQDVGLGYVKLGQASSTLSGGENQRVKLAWFLSQEKAEPAIFVFDEPTTGLHFHDIKRLLEAFDALISRGHTVIVIEHNMDVIKCADYVVDLGPEGGEGGGRLVCAGTPEEVARCAASYTGQFLREKLHAAPGADRS